MNHRSILERVPDPVRAVAERSFGSGRAGVLIGCDAAARSVRNRCLSAPSVVTLVG